MAGHELEAASDYLMGLIRAIQGIKAAPDKPPTSMAFFPYAVSWPGRGWAHVNGTLPAYRSITSIRLQIHMSLIDLALSIDAIFPYHDRVLDVIFDRDNATLGGNVSTIMADELVYPTWEFGEMGWGKAETVGYDFTIPVKLLRQ